MCRHTGGVVSRGWLKLRVSRRTVELLDRRDLLHQIDILFPVHPTVHRRVMIRHCFGILSSVYLKTENLIRRVRLLARFYLIHTDWTLNTIGVTVNHGAK